MDLSDSEKWRKDLKTFSTQNVWKIFFSAFLLHAPLSIIHLYSLLPENQSQTKSWDSSHCGSLALKYKESSICSQEKFHQKEILLVFKIMASFDWWRFMMLEEKGNVCKKRKILDWNQFKFPLVSILWHF